MKKAILTVFILVLAAISGLCQTKNVESKLNFGFEEIVEGRPDGWTHFGRAEYQIYLDSVKPAVMKY